MGRSIKKGPFVQPVPVSYTHLALKGKDVTLEIRKNGVTYTLNGQKIGPITKIWYNFDENLETTLQPVEE